MSTRKKSVVWNFFNQTSATTGTCTTCKAVISFKGCSTANLHRHIKTRHPTLQLTEVREEAQTSQAQPAPRAHRAQGDQTTLTNFLQRPMNPLWQKNVDEKLLMMIATDLQLFSIVEDVGFREYSKALNPSYKLPSRKTISQSLIPDCFLKCHAAVKEKVAHAEAVCLTTDCWTSRANSSFMSVTCHFIDDFEMVSYLLDCFEFTERHTADNLAEKLRGIAAEWSVADKMVACVTDNAANVTLAVRKANWRHLPCFAHTLNLIVRRALDTMHSTLEKIKGIVQYFHKSTVSK